MQLLEMVQKIELVQTCGACPEQYDAFIEDVQVGYLRLRHGNFTVQYPDVRGEVIYSASPDGDGLFEDHEREGYLAAARLYLVNRHYKEVHGDGMVHLYDHCAGCNETIDTDNDLFVTENGKKYCKDCRKVTL